MPSTRVINMKTDPNECTVRIDRRTVWGNPYKLEKDTRGHRIESVCQYIAWLSGNQDLLKRLPELKGQVLGCWCKPEICHGDVLAQFADNWYQIAEQQGTICRPPRYFHFPSKVVSNGRPVLLRALLTLHKGFWVDGSRMGGPSTPVDERRIIAWITEKHGVFHILGTPYVEWKPGEDPDDALDRLEGAIQEIISDYDDGIQALKAAEELPSKYSEPGPGVDDIQREYTRLLTEAKKGPCDEQRN